MLLITKTITLKDEKVNDVGVVVDQFALLSEGTDEDEVIKYSATPMLSVAAKEFTATVSDEALDGMVKAVIVGAVTSPGGYVSSAPMSQAEPCVRA